MIREIRYNPQAVTGLIIIFCMLLLALLAPVLAPHDPGTIDIAHTYAPASAQYPLGTDEMGRCVLSRLLYGARYSLGIAVPTLLLLAVFSTAVATVCTYAGGRVDRVFSAVCDVFMAFPPLLVAVTLIGSLGHGTVNIMISILFPCGYGLPRSSELLSFRKKTSNMFWPAGLPAAATCRSFSAISCPTSCPTCWSISARGWRPLC
ncbi:N-terminal TM domain of oligopeptide transport permease C [Desulfitobacterium chlororespirans DSM 11544]|uniref:N-terminal TM domain of oligopeptide transport permease C n=1 Tax=Desulfitobacterium chlororespirans DSM 11544 TaxID=1121395 RepID=A0A1M7TIL1_9FIRM|nr:N-terminal TM domain of oligopeptide transport permease C [Desulfitobacterium chlororespirans DSM 11544]